MCALVTGVQTCALPICRLSCHWRRPVPGTTQGRSSDIGSFFEHLARNDDAHDFIGAFKNLVDAGAAYQELKEIGRASCRERVCKYGEISVVGIELKKKFLSEYT